LKPRGKVSQTAPLASPHRHTRATFRRPGRNAAIQVRLAQTVLILATNRLICARSPASWLRLLTAPSRRHVRVATNQLQFAGCVLLPSPAAAQSQRGSPARSRSRHLRPADALPARSLPGGRLHSYSGGSPPAARSACSSPRPGTGSGVWLPVLLPHSRKRVGIRPRNGPATARAVITLAGNGPETGHRQAGVADQEGHPRASSPSPFVPFPAAQPSRTGVVPDSASAFSPCFL
jgi:hypothetical protein